MNLVLAAFKGVSSVASNNNNANREFDRNSKSICPRTDKYLGQIANNAIQYSIIAAGIYAAVKGAQMLLCRPMPRLNGKVRRD